MAGLGYGIAGFMEGLNNGIRVRQAMDATDLAERRAQIAEEENQRAQERFSLEKDLSQSQEGRASTKFNQEQGEWAANAPVREAERKNSLETADFNRDTRNHNRSEWKYQDEQRVKNEPVLDAERLQSLDKIKRDKTEWGWKAEDRAAEQPIKDAERVNRLTKTQIEGRGLQQQANIEKTILDAGTEARQNFEAEKSKSIVTGKDAAGNDTFTVDGRAVGSKAEAEALYDQTHGDFTNYYVNNAGRKIHDHYLEIGDAKTADVWANWLKDKNTKESITLSGRAIEAANLGDWESVNKSVGELAKPKYMSRVQGYTPSFEPIVENGKTVGIKSTYTNPDTGASFSKESRDMREFAPELEYLTNPATRFENLISNYKAQIEATTKGATKNLEEAAKARAQTGVDLQKEIAIALKDQLKILEESTDVAVRRLTPEQKAERARQMVMSVYGLTPPPGAATPGAARPPAPTGQPPMLTPR